MPRGLAGQSDLRGPQGGAFHPGRVWHPVAPARSCSRSVATLCDTVDPSRPRTLDPDHAQPARLHQAARHGRATARPRDPRQALALHPLLRPLEPEDGGQAPRAGAPDRHPPREPRGRDPGRQEGRRPRGPGEDRARGRLRRHAALDARQQPRQPVVPRRRRASGRRDRRPPRGRHDPQGRGAVGHPLRGPPPGPAGGAPQVEAPAPRPRHPRDRARRDQRRGDLRREPAHAGDQLRARGPRRLAPHEDDAGGRRPSRLPGAHGPRPEAPRCPAPDGAAGPLALLARAHGRRVRGHRRASLLRPLRRHLRPARLRGPVPGRLPARLRRRLVAPPEPDRDRKEGLQPAGRGGRLRQARARGDARRARRPHARRQDAGRRHLEAVQGDGDARQAARGQGPGARPPLRLRPMSAGAFFAQHEVHVGQDVAGRALAVSDADVARYEAGTGGASTRPAGAAPALILHSEVYRSLAWYLPNIFGNLHARQEWELFAPVLVGQPIRTRATVVDRYRKRNREYVVNEVLVTDAEGRWLQRSRTHQSFLVEDGGRDTVVDREREKRPERVFTVGEGPGEPIGPFTRPITLAMCEAFSGPEKNYHNDREMARMLGFPDIVVQGMLSVCLVSELMTETFGAGWLLGGKMDVRLVNVVWVDDVLATRGKVREEVAEGGHRRVHLDVWCEKADGTKTLVGTASALR